MNSGSSIFFQIFILTHNRSHYLMESVESVLNQNYAFFEVIVSDNSTNDETETIFSSFVHPKLVYKRRKACTANEHFNLILKEASADYFMMFHDDDVMFANMLSTYNNYINQNPDIKAIGSNAFLLKGEKRTKTLFNKNRLGDLNYLNFENLARLYLTNDIIATFPGYVYSLKTIQNNEITFQGDSFSKYADVIFLLNISKQKNILNISEPLMHYRTHDLNDSKINDFLSRLKLVKFIKENIVTTNRDKDIISYRLFNIYSELVTKHYRVPPFHLISLKKLFKISKLFIRNKEFKMTFKIIIIQILILLKIIVSKTFNAFRLKK